MTEQSKKPTLFDVLGPGKTFVAGFISALLIFFSIGFFVLLFKGSAIDFKTGADKVVFGNSDTTQPSDNVADPKVDSGTDEISIAPITSNDHVRGDLAKAQAVIVEFSDYDCPFCHRFHPTMKQIMTDYGDKIAWVYRHFPLDSLHPDARTKAEASECVAKLGGNEAFWVFTDALYDESRGTIQVSQLGSLAEEAGVDKSDFQTCLDNGETKDLVQADYQDAVASGGLGTPHSIVMTRDGQTIPLSGALPVGDIKAVLDPILE